MENNENVMNNDEQYEFWMGDDYVGPEPEWGLNEAVMYFDDKKLVIAFGDGRVAEMELERQEEVDVVKMVLADANTWAIFLGSLSAALKEKM